MQNRHRIQLIITAFAMLLVVVMIGGTWAFLTQGIYLQNGFKLGEYDTTIQEVFDPPSDWKPGSMINKDVRVSNNGTVPVYAKITLNQKWIRKGNVYDSAGAPIPPLAGQSFPLTFDTSSGQQYAAQITWGSEVVLLASGVSADTSLRLGLPTVTTPAQAAGKWLLLSETPDSDGNYTAYYIGVLNGKTTSPLLLDGVLMNPNIQATILEDNTVYDTTSQKWVTTTKLNPTSSYENGKYTLTITMNTVQATTAAAGNMFPTTGAQEQEIIEYLKEYGVTGPQVDIGSSSSQQNKLYIDNVSGELTFTPVSADNQNWFLTHLNMIPGESYEDELLIENHTEESYDLYMQAVPLEQEENLDEVLECIHMKVFYKDELVYDGTATGAEYPASINDLQEQIYLGDYAPASAESMQVKLTLDKDTPIELSGLFSRIDWKFTADQNVVPTPTPSTSPGASPSPTPAQTNPPTATPTVTATPIASATPTATTVPTSIVKTGDSTSVLLYTCLMTVSGILLLVCILALRKMKKKDTKPPQW